MPADNLISDHIHDPPTFLAYSLNAQLKQLFPDKTVSETDAWEFQFEEFASEGHCHLTLHEDWPLHELLQWEGGERVQKRVGIGAWRVEWEGQSFDLMSASWTTSCGTEMRSWLISDDHAIAEKFVETVCRWADELRQVILTFSSGYWQRSRALYDSIQQSTLESLIMPGNLKQNIVGDFERFLASKDRYESFGATWKRGVLLTGPPGNGKTHFIRALINHLDIPCFYVKSFEMRDQFASSGIQAVYRTVRRSRPCIVVLEDLDSLIDDSNRTYFLNELDGFESNEGIITIATTNHPERLDTAILDRPSRFDQKWQFDLPAVEERRAYLQAWNDKLPAVSQMSESDTNRIADVTSNFSFAFLKELCLGSILSWVQGESDSHLVDAILSYRDLLVSQSPNLEESGQKYETGKIRSTC